jgi:hypothetical protein
MLWKLVAHRLAEFYIGLADKIVGGCEPDEVGHGFQVPDDDAWFHVLATLLPAWPLTGRTACLASTNKSLA